ncbi:hypothetical protein [Bacillus sp. OV322]|nr:hypothetical protein [Bacillus sp. OV322]
MNQRLEGKVPNFSRISGTGEMQAELGMLICPLAESRHPGTEISQLVPY